MKVLSSDFTVEWEVWDDPGDYPNACAQFALPSYSFVSGLEGSCRVELDENEAGEAASVGLNKYDELYDVASDEVPDGIDVCEWDAEWIDWCIVEVRAVDVDGSDYGAEDWSP